MNRKEIQTLIEETENSTTKVLTEQELEAIIVSNECSTYQALSAIYASHLNLLKVTGYESYMMDNIKD